MANSVKEAQGWGGLHPPVNRIMMIVYSVLFIGGEDAVIHLCIYKILFFNRVKWFYKYVKDLLYVMAT